MPSHSEQISEVQAKPAVSDIHDSMVQQFMDSRPVAFNANKSGSGLGAFGTVELTGDLSQSKCGPGTKCGNFNPGETQVMTATPASGEVPGKPQDGSKPPVKPPAELPHKLNDDGTRPVKPHTVFKDGEIQLADPVKKGLGGKPPFLGYIPSGKPGEGKPGEKPEGKPDKYLKDPEGKDGKVAGGKDGKVAGGKDGGWKNVDLDALKRKLAELAPQKPEVHYTPEQLAEMRAKKEAMWREMQTSGSHIEATQPVNGGPHVVKPHDSASAHHAATAHRNPHHGTTQGNSSRH